MFSLLNFESVELHHIYTEALIQTHIYISYLSIHLMQNKRELKKNQLHVTWFFYTPFQTPKFESTISKDWTLHL